MPVVLQPTRRKRTRVLLSSDSASTSNGDFVDATDLNLDQQILRSYQRRPIASDESVCSTDDAADRVETASDNKDFVATDNESSSKQRTGPLLNVDSRWPSLEGYFTPGTHEMPPKNGSFHLDRGIYNAMSSSIKNRHITYAEWANVMRDKIKEFNSFCAYVNLYHTWNKVSFACTFKCKFPNCTSTCKIKHNKDDGFYFITH